MGATTLTQDRLASPRELTAAWRRVKKSNGGPGFVVAARRLGWSAGKLHLALQGFVPPAMRLRLSQLRAMFEETELEVVR